MVFFFFLNLPVLPGARSVVQARSPLYSLAFIPSPRFFCLSVSLSIYSLETAVLWKNEFPATLSICLSRLSIYISVSAYLSLSLSLGIRKLWNSNQHISYFFPTFLMETKLQRISSNFVSRPILNSAVLSRDLMALPDVGQVEIAERYPCFTLLSSGAHLHSDPTTNNKQSSD